jgi:NAD(P)-dependent dehydrogenase (short-subunit alcohol dehydrogenase family)
MRRKMKKELLIFGANGALGRGVSAALLKKNYDKIYLIDFNIGKENINTKKTVIKIDNQDLSVEKNVAEIFLKIDPSKDTFFFLYSTVGGFAGGKLIRDTDEAEWDKMMSMNLKSNFFIAKYFSRLVEKSAGGSICFTAAATGINPEAGKGSYGISKSGLIHLVKTLALEGISIKLSANAIAPYIIDTPANREWMKDADYEKWIKSEEIGELAYNIFENFRFFSGNVMSLSSRLIVQE